MAAFIPLSFFIYSLSNLPQYSKQKHLDQTNQLYYHDDVKKTMSNRVTPPTEPNVRDRQEHSFTGLGASPFIRLPHGPNPQHKHVADGSILFTPQHNVDYRQNMTNTYLETLDWRLTPHFNSFWNNYADLHLSEPCLQNIENFSNKKI